MIIRQTKIFLVGNVGLLLAFLFCLTPMFGYTQLSQRIANQILVPSRPLEVGDSIDSYFYQVLSDSKNINGSLPNLRGKLVVLDFWDVSCAPCIAAMPEMEKLQKKFSDKIQIILVTKNDSGNVKRLRNRIKKLESIELPNITNDTILSSLFPYISVPTHVWIDNNGRICFITDGYNTNDSSISKFINSEEINLPIKHEATNFNFTLQLISEGNGKYLKNTKQYSIFTNRISDWHGGLIGEIRDSATKRVLGIRSINTTASTLYKKAYQNEVQNFSKQLVLQVKDSSTLLPTLKLLHDERWKNDNLYCYEMKLPVKRSDEVYELMRRDLDEFFGFESRIEIRSVKGLVLTCIRSKRKPSKGGEALIQLSNDQSNLRLKNYSPKYLVSFLDSRFSLPVILDSVNLFYNLDLDIFLPEKHYSIDEINAVLSSYGLILIQSTVRLKHIVISDKKNKDGK